MNRAEALALLETRRAALRERAGAIVMVTVFLFAVLHAAVTGDLLGDT